MKKLLFLIAGILYILHQDFWLWDNATLVLGFFPIGLLYHVIFCLAACGLMIALVRYAWPAHLDGDEPPAGGEGRGES